jgi:FKBP-type peptidyl-prolyl cis-trans isomerase FkpA
MIKIWIFLALYLFLSASCANNDQKLNDKTTPNKQELLFRVNKYLVKKDADAINGFVKRHGWSMQQTQSGLWYEILDKGNGIRANNGKIASFSYKLWLLDGTLCYSSDSLGNKSFRIGKGGVEPGLEEGILLLNEGAKARFIMPPHLAYGLMGDENKIPARSTIIYELNLLKLSD